MFILNIYYLLHYQYIIIIRFFGNYLSLSQKGSEDVCANSNIIGPNAFWVPEWRSTRSYFKSRANKYLSMNKTLCVYCKEKRGGDFEEFELKPAASLESPFLPANYGSFPPQVK